MLTMPYPKIPFTRRTADPDTLVYANPHPRAGTPLPVTTIDNVRYVQLGSVLYPQATLLGLDQDDYVPRCKFARDRDADIVDQCRRGFTLSSIAAQYGVTKQRMKAIVDRLVAEGLCEKPRDVRLRTLNSTPAQPKPVATPAPVARAMPTPAITDPKLAAVLNDWRTGEDDEDYD